jgi:hypothetical protein
MFGIIRIDLVPLHPGAEVVRLEREDAVFGLARLHTPTAADALLDVDDHGPPMPRPRRRSLVPCRPRGDHVVSHAACGRCRQHHQICPLLEERSAIEWHMDLQSELRRMRLVTGRAGLETSVVGEVDGLETGGFAADG